MSYSKELITELGLPKINLKDVGAAIEQGIQEPMIQQVQPTAPKTQPGVITALGQKIDVNPVLAAVPPVAAKSTQAAIDTAFSTPNLIKAGAAALAGGALIGGGLALGRSLGRRIGNIGSKKDKKKLNEKSKKDDLYYRQVDLDPYAPRYTVPQLATTAGGLAGTTLGSQVGMRLGQATNIPGAGIVGLGVGGALGGALGSIGAYQLAKMARPKKKKPKKLVQYYR